MKNKSTQMTFTNIHKTSVGTSLSLRAEDKVKAVYPDAILKWDLVHEPTKWDWSTDGSHQGKGFLAKGVWVGTRCLAFGGKYEHEIWRRAWKQIGKEMLKRLES